MPYRDNDADPLDPAEEVEGSAADDDHADRCPTCGRYYYDEDFALTQCPHCGASLTKMSGWMKVGLLVCLGLAVGWAVWG